MSKNHFFHIIYLRFKLWPLSLHFGPNLSLYLRSIYHVPGNWDSCFCRAHNQSTEILEVELVSGTAGSENRNATRFQDLCFSLGIALNQREAPPSGNASSLGAACIQRLRSEGYQGLTFCLDSRRIWRAIPALDQLRRLGDLRRSDSWQVWRTWLSLLFLFWKKWKEINMQWIHIRLSIKEEQPPGTVTPL